MRKTELMGLLGVGVLLAVLLWPRAATPLVSSSYPVSHWWEPWWWNGFHPRPHPNPEPDHHRLGPGGGQQRGGNLQPGGWVGGDGGGQQRGGHLQPGGWVGGNGGGQQHGGHLQPF